MKILLLSQWCPPEPEELFLELAASLQAAGHEVTVLTGFPNFPLGRLYPGYKMKLFQKETIDGIPIVRVPLFPDHSRSAIRRSLNILSFALSASVLGPWLTPRVDVIHVVHPPLTIGWPACVLGLLKRVPFTYEIHDMWPETLQTTGLLNSPRLLRCIGWAAKRVYRRAAAIRVISPGFRDNLLGKGVPADKIHLISNWVNTDRYRPMEPDRELAQKLGLAGSFNIMFAGMIGPAQGLQVILDAADLLRDLPDVQFVLVGDGNDVKRLQENAKALNLDNVRFLGRHPAEAMPGLYALSDALLVHLRDDPLFRITVPHKTFAYMSSAKPILAAVKGDVAEMVKSTQSGLTCPPSDPQAMADAVRELRAMSPDQRDALAQNGRRAACELFGREHLTGQIAEMLEDVVQQRRPEKKVHAVSPS